MLNDHQSDSTTEIFYHYMRVVKGSLDHVSRKMKWSFHTDNTELPFQELFFFFLSKLEFLCMLRVTTVFYKETRQNDCIENNLTTFRDCFRAKCSFRHVD